MHARTNNTALTMLTSRGPNSVDDKDQGNKAREDVFREHGHMLHESTEVEDRDQNGEERTPHANPEVEGHELHIGTHSHVIHHEGVSQERTGRSEDGQGLPCEGGEDHARDGCRHNHFQHSELAIGAVQEAASEGDGGRQSCDEEVENGRQRFLEVLRLERIRPVARVERQPPTQVQPQASSNFPSKLQGPVILLGRVVDIAGLIADHCLGLGHGSAAMFRGLRWGGCSRLERLEPLRAHKNHGLLGSESPTKLRNVFYICAAIENSAAPEISRCLAELVPLPADLFLVGSGLGFRASGLSKLQV